MLLEDSDFSGTAGDPTPVTIFVHVFHLEVWPEILAGLNKLSLRYQLILTGPHPQAAVQLPDNAVEIEFRQTANVGRDIAPFLVAFRETRLTTDICLKLHTKRSLHRSDGEIWRRSILADLLDDPDGVSHTVRLLRENPKVGLVSPNRHLVPIGLFLGANEANLRHLLEIYGIDASAMDMSKAFFVAGSMFWFRSAALALVLKRSSAIEFEPEGGQLDGTRAHAHERIFAVLAETSGFASVTVDELKQRDVPAFRALAASESAKNDDAQFSNTREPLRISAFLNPSQRQADGVRRALQLYRKLPVGIRRFIRRSFRMPL